jgi:hypothetical protein
MHFVTCSNPVPEDIDRLGPPVLRLGGIKSNSPLSIQLHITSFAALAINNVVINPLLKDFKITL